MDTLDLLEREAERKRKRRYDSPEESRVRGRDSAEESSIQSRDSPECKRKKRGEESPGGRRKRKRTEDDSGGNQMRQVGTIIVHQNLIFSNLHSDNRGPIIRVRHRLELHRAYTHKDLKNTKIGTAVTRLQYIQYTEVVANMYVCSP
jgi:hypothetical protein